ncbi:MAG: response regulator [Lachnospiraceae bacterium]|nr:response regulator [Lachnospiraceae bacterium]
MVSCGNVVLFYRIHIGTGHDRGISGEKPQCRYGFLLFSILVTINAWGRYLLAASESLEMAIWANKFLYIGGCYVPLVMLVILARLCNLKLSKVLLGVLTLYSTVVMFLVMTIGKSQIYYKSVAMGYGNGYNYLIKEYGPGHILYPVMMILYAVIMVYYCIYAVRRRKLLSFRLVMTISGVGFSCFFVYILERIIGSSISFLSVGYLVGIALLIKYFERLNMYDISSNIANAVEKMKEYGYIVFDYKYRYVNANDLIKEVFPEIKTWFVDRVVQDENSYVYKEVVQYLMDWNGEESSEKIVESEGRFFQLDIRRISYGSKESVGYLLEFVDRTLETKYYNAIEEYNIRLEKAVEEQTEELREKQKMIQEMFVQTVTALSEAVDAKDRYTSGHSKRVAEYSRLIAQRLGKSREEQEEIYRAGLLHDIGKIRVPAEIINKPGRLTDEEYNMIKIHPVTGYHILRGITGSGYIANAAKYHHERYDGTGYPNGLAGEKIPEVARILGVADAYDAMASDRSYRKALPQDMVRAEIEKGKGSQFDPDMADIILRMIDEDEQYTMKQNVSAQRKILIIDDEIINSRIIVGILQGEPMYEIFYAEGGKQALEVLEKETFDLIMLDVQMPEMDGLETLRLIREKYQTPVILMTGDKTLAEAREFAELACDDYITKPLLPILVKEVVHHMTERTTLV